jgi:hypothetical protein
METFYLLIFIPIIIAAVAKVYFKHTFTWPEVAAQCLGITVILTGIWFAGNMSQTADTEIWNGSIVEKKREHGKYVRTYQCNCYQTCSGSGNTRTCTRHCQTCYENHYTVEWYMNTTIGKIRLAYLDRTSRSVYNSPNPANYVNAQVGAICSREVGYTNYVKAVPESLFNKYSESELEEFAPLIPAYPRVHSIYKVNRVLTPGVSGVNIAAWNDYLGEWQKTLGPSHEVNIIMIMVNSANQMYRHALEQAWLGGKKNDVIVLVGTSNYPAIDWVDTITLGSNSGNELMTVQMRDNIMKIGTLQDHVAVVDAVGSTVRDKFDRKPMADYEYLKSEIEPPTWVIIMAFFLSIALSIGATIFFHKKDVFNSEPRRRFR